MAGPAGCGIDHIHTTAGDVLDHLGVNIGALVLVGMDMPMIHGRTQILTDAAVEMVDKGVTQACAIGQRCHITVLVGPFVHSEGVDIPGGHIELIEHIGNGAICAGPLVGADHREGGIVDIGHQNAVEHILHHMQSGVHNHLHGEAVFVGVFHILTLDITDALQLLQGQIAVGQPGCRFEAKFIIKSHSFHSSFHNHKT